jgi:hypothetical protein
VKDAVLREEPSKDAMRGVRVRDFHCRDFRQPLLQFREHLLL